MSIRIGQGFDVHAFGPGNHITLGGVMIPYKHGLIAHSDGDVLVHALCDALLGSLALGDIGDHFPDSDERYRNINSMELLDHVYCLIKNSGWNIVNADITIIAEKPKMAPFKEAMVNNISTALNTEKGNISIKATTTEKMGFTGREEGVAVFATILLSAGNAL